MNLKEIDENKIDLDWAKQLLTKGLVFENSPKQGDIIFVFGCPSNRHRKARLEKAVFLYKQGYAKKILVSGGQVKEKREGIIMKEELLTMGVLEEDILLEKDSLNTAQNIIASLFTIEKAMHLGTIRHIIFVSDEAHMKRCLLSAKRYLPSYITFSYAMSSIQLEDEKEENLIKEAKKLVLYAKKNYIAEQL